MGELATCDCCDCQHLYLRFQALKPACERSCFVCFCQFTSVRSSKCVRMSLGLSLLQKKGSKINQNYVTAGQVCIKYCHIFFPTSHKLKIGTWCFGIFKYLKSIQNYHLLNCETMKLVFLFTLTLKNYFWQFVPLEKRIPCEAWMVVKIASPNQKLSGCSRISSVRLNCSNTAAISLCPSLIVQ